MDEAIELLEQERDRYTSLYDETKAQNAAILAQAERIRQELWGIGEGIDRMNRAIDALSQVQRESQGSVLDE